MSTPFLDIDGFIGKYGYSKTYVKNFLAENKGKAVNANISSLGGDIDHGLHIHDQFAAHKNVTADLTGFVASSATVISQGCSHIKMSANAFFLIHKVMSWVDEWGYMNEDDIANVIAQLEKEKKENEKMTLVIAQLYVKKTGKTINEILDLMKEETWLTAAEAKEWGFVDEVYEPAEKVDLFANQKVMSMIKANDLPTPERKSNPGSGSGSGSANNAELIEQVGDSLYNKIKNLFPGKTNSKNKTDMKKFDFVNKVLNVQNLESEDDKGVYLNETQLAAIDAQLKEKSNAVEKYNTTVTLLDELGPAFKNAETVEAKLDVVREKLAAKPGAKPTNSAGSGSGSGRANDGVDYETLNSLSHMKEAENLV